MFRFCRLFPWTGALLLAIGALLASITVPRQASAQGVWNQSAGLATLPSASQFKDLSGATISSDGVLWSVDNKLNDVIAWQPSGSGWSLIGSWDLDIYGLSDTEAVSWIDGTWNGSGSRLAVVDEASNRVVVVAVGSTGSSLERTIDLAPYVGAAGNDGLEAIAWSQDESTTSEDIFYVGMETTAELFRVAVPAGSSQPSSVQGMPLSIAEIAGLADDPGSNAIYVISQADKKVYETTSTGATPTELFSVASMAQPEGLHFDPTSMTLHVLGEGNQEYASWQQASTPAPPTPTPTSIPTDSGTISVRIDRSSDDAEELANGTMYLDSSDLELTWDRNGHQTVGLRFASVPVPAGVTITSASIELETDELNSGSTSLAIQGEATGDAATFSWSPGDVSSRPTTDAQVTWQPAPWQSWSQKHTTPDLAVVVQELVNRSDWQPNQAMAFVVSGTGERTARSFDGQSSAAPVLTVSWEAGAPTPAPTPQPTAEPTPEPTAEPTPEPTVPQTGTTASATVQVSGGNDDAEERANGSMYLNSSDLELTWDGGGHQRVGIRFGNIPVPAGAAVTSASLEFETDERNSGAASLVIAGHATNDAATFTSASGNISSRPTTSATATWQPTPWQTTNERHTSPDLAPIINEIVGRPDWDQGNALALIISGTGERTAESWNGERSAAPRLHLTWTIGGTATSPSPEPTPTAEPTPTVPSSPTTVTVPITSGTDDIEVRPDGSHHVSSGDLDVSSATMPVALRFDVCIPAGTSVLEAHLLMTADEADAAPTAATVRAEASPNAAAFGAQLVGDRLLTLASVAWPAWSTWTPGTVETSPDLSSLLAEVASAGWSGCGNVVLVIEGNGDREASSYESNPTAAPKLVLTVG